MHTMTLYYFIVKFINRTDCLLSYFSQPNLTLLNIIGKNVNIEKEIPFHYQHC